MSISAEEFGALSQQLIELKTAKYESQDREKKLLHGMGRKEYQQPEIFLKYTSTRSQRGDTKRKRDIMGKGRKEIKEREKERKRREKENERRRGGEERGSKRNDQFTSPPLLFVVVEIKVLKDQVASLENEKNSHGIDLRIFLFVARSASSLFLFIFVTRKLKSRLEFVIYLHLIYFLKTSPD